MQRDSVILLPQTARTAPSAAAGERPGAARIALGFADEAAWLGGGLRADGLHEAYAAQPEDCPATLGFALLIARLRQQASPRPTLWLQEGGRAAQPYGPGLAELGIDPDTITLITLADGRAVLRAGLDALRQGGATVLIELHGRQPLLDLTASRRLVFAAQESGALALLVRSNASPATSAAHSRWRVASAPSRPLAAKAPGHPAFDLTLLRQRGGREGLHIILEWNRDTAAFHERRPAYGADFDTAGRQPPPLSGAVPALASGRAGGAGRRRAG